MTAKASSPNFNVYFYRFKESMYYSIFVFLMVLLVGVILLIYAVIPQFQNVFTLNEEVKSAKSRITVLNNNKAFLQSVNNSTLKNDLEISFSALPSEKDFSGIITALNYISAKSGATLDDYTLAIGDLSTPTEGLEAYFPMRVDVVVTGSKESIFNFLKTSQEVLPLSEIASVETDFNSAQISFDFFFKVYKNENYSIATPIAPINMKGKQALRQIGSFRIPFSTSTNTPVGSESAVAGNPF